MKIVGLTGSIAMGKSTAARLIRRLGIPVFDADAAVHRLMAPGGDAVAAVREAFPMADDGTGGIDRRKLGPIVFGNPERLRRLERILHPRVGAMERRFLMANRSRRCPLVVLDIPLLFEGGGERRCDAVMVVSAPVFLQRQRAMQRAGMTAERLKAILAQQMSDLEKRRRTRYVIASGLGLRHALGDIRRHLRSIGARKGR